MAPVGWKMKFGRKQLKRANYMSWNGCKTAVMYGNLGVLKWLRENEFPWNSEECHRLATIFKQFEMEKWIMKNMKK